MAERRFLTDAEIDELIGELRTAGMTADSPAPWVDQAQAAEAENVGQFAATKRQRVAALGWHDPGTKMIEGEAVRTVDRFVFKMIFATMSANPARCPHVLQSFQPTIMHCDPPTWTCHRCAPAFAQDPTLERQPRYDRVCDGCGETVTALTPFQAPWRTVTISGHLCDACIAILDHVRASGSEIPVVGRNESCPCRSGRKYKHCHGRRAAG